VKLTCFAVLAVASPLQAATIYVDIANCPGPGDGSIGNPYCSIQTAINNAVATDEVVVAAGTYVEPVNLMGKAITVRSTAPTDPEVVLATIIDAGGATSAVTCISGEGPETVLNGLVITGGTLPMKTTSSCSPCPGGPQRRQHRGRDRLPGRAGRVGGVPVTKSAPIKALLG